jgi:hypothetical protein
MLQNVHNFKIQNLYYPRNNIIVVKDKDDAISGTYIKKKINISVAKPKGNTVDTADRIILKN